MTILRPLAPLLILAFVAGCSQEKKTDLSNGNTGTGTPSATAGKSPDAGEQKPATPLELAVAERKAAADAYITARDAFRAEAEQVKSKSAEIAKAKEAGDNETLAKLRDEYNKLRARMADAKSAFDAAREVNAAAVEKLKSLRTQAAAPQN